MFRESKEFDDYDKREIDESIKGIRVLTIDDLLGMPDDDGLEWLVDRFVLKQAITTVSGLPNHFKSWFVQYLCYCVAAGKPFLGCFECEKTGVLIIDREVPPRRAAKRWRLFGDLSGLPIYFYPYDASFSLLNEKIAYDIRDLVEKYNVGLVVIDTFNRSHGGKDVNSAQDVIQAFEPLKRLISDVAIILVHHSNKKGYTKEVPTGEELLGSTDFMAEIDMLFTLRKRTETSISVHNIKAKDSELFAPFEIELETSDEGYVSFSYRGEYIPEKSTGTLRREKIIEVLRSKKKSKAELLFELGENEGTISNDLTRLKKNGVVGSHLVGREAFYFLLDKHREDERFTGDSAPVEQEQLKVDESPVNTEINASLSGNESKENVVKAFNEVFGVDDL